MLLRTLLLAALLAAVGLPARADEKKTEEKKTQARQDQPAATVVTDKDAGGKVTLRKGGTLLVKLGAQAGTGYTWVVARNNEKVLEPAGKPTTERAGKGKQVGGPELLVQKFKAVGEGESKLEMQYKRTFEKDKKPAREFSVTVTVR